MKGRGTDRAVGFNHVSYAIMHPQVHIKAVIIFLSVSSSTSVFGDVTSSLQWVRGRRKREIEFYSSLWMM